MLDRSVAQAFNGDDRDLRMCLLVEFCTERENMGRKDITAGVAQLAKTGDVIC